LIFLGITSSNSFWFSTDFHPAADSWLVKYPWLKYNPKLNAMLLWALWVTNEKAKALVNCPFSNLFIFYHTGQTAQLVCAQEIG